MPNLVHHVATLLVGTPDRVIGSSTTVVLLATLRSCLRRRGMMEPRRTPRDHLEEWCDAVFYLLDLPRYFRLQRPPDVRSRERRRSRLVAGREDVDQDAA